MTDVTLVDIMCMNTHRKYYQATTKAYFNYLSLLIMYSIKCQLEIESEKFYSNI